jgi:predicted unusual protein kinase regulating ubiquinone biosynthesis (AarF/ABC1/UbiB family)
MSKKDLPASRFGRAARMALLGARTGAGWVFDGDGKKSAKAAAGVLGQMRGLAAKAGQMASYVDGLVPADKREAFEIALGALRSATPASDPEAIRAVVEEDLGSPVGELFASWEPEPFASASIGQVHRATLHDGTEVAVKVQHPGIDRAVESDLKNAGVMANMNAFAFGAKMGIKEGMDEMAEVFRQELDYELEAERQERFAALYTGGTHIRVPAVIRQRSSRRVLTTVMVHGQSFEEACEADAELRTTWAEVLWRFVIHSTIVGGLFNGDPHPGNFIFHADGSITALDFGCVIEIPPRRQAISRALHRGAIEGDLPAFYTAARQMMEMPAREGLPSEDEPAYHHLILQFCRRLFEPLFDSPYQITHEWAASLVDDCMDLGKKAILTKAGEVVTMPQGMLFLNRLQFGFYSVLARLEVPVDYAGVEREVLGLGGTETGS